MSSKKYIDAHCHLADPKLADDLEAVLKRSEKAGVVEWVQGGIGPEDWDHQKKLLKLRPEHIYLAFGLHPWWVASSLEGEVISALKLLESELPKAHCLGELGLDYMPRFLGKVQLQQEVFRAQLLLNEGIKKPLILHIVQAHGDALQILKNFPKQSGVVHAFSEGKDILKKYLDLGFFISVGAAVTRAGYQKLKDSLSYIPIERLILETDAPGSRPEVRNEPTFLLSVAQTVSDIRKDFPPEALLEASRRNMKGLLASS